MGRIAEALKKAQQERATRLEEEARAAESAASSAPFVLDTDSEQLTGQAAIPQPFLIGASPLVPDAIDPQVLALHQPACAVSEKFRSLRTRLLTGNPTGASRTYAITSSLPREGKSLTAANLAFSLAELRHLRVAVVDGDIHRRGLSRLMGALDRPGLCEVMRGEKALAEVCVPAVRSNLYFLPVGDPQKAAASDLLVGARASSGFREINERFHYAIVDTPAATTVADIGLIAPLCHCVLVIARMHSTPEPTLRRCIQMLQANQLNVAGCVLTGCDEEEAYCA